jgi:hypothetical protein
MRISGPWLGCLVLATPGQTDRILLDTSAVRKVIHGDAMRSTSRG